MKILKTIVIASIGILVIPALALANVPYKFFGKVKVVSKKSEIVKACNCDHCEKGETDNK